MEGRYDAIRGHRTDCNTSPLSVPVSHSPVSREASRDFVALDMWLHTTYMFIFGFGLVGLGIIFYFLDSGS